jgi:hypothetical protein
MQDCKPVATPLEACFKCPSLAPTPTCDQNIPYRQAVGKLIYAASGTRPDISYATSLVSRYLSGWNSKLWQVVKRILRYLQATKEFGLLFNKKFSNKITLVGYSDSDWGGDPLDRISTTGYLFQLCGAPISWSSKKQSTIAYPLLKLNIMQLHILPRRPCGYVLY